MVRNHHRHFTVAANAERLVERLENRFKLRAQVSGVNPIARGQLFRQRHHFFSSGMECAGVGKAGAQSQPALLQGQTELFSHRANFLTRGFAEQIVHMVIAQCGVTNQRADVNSGFRLLHRLCVGGNRWVDKLCRVTE
ncbi:hypothetical protein D3C75_560050 [compost metagenome]